MQTKNKILITIITLVSFNLAVLLGFFFYLDHQYSQKYQNLEEGIQEKALEIQETKPEEEQQNQENNVFEMFEQRRQPTPEDFFDGFSLFEEDNFFDKEVEIPRNLDEGGGSMFSKESWQTSINWKEVSYSIIQENNKINWYIQTNNKDLLQEIDNKLQDINIQTTQKENKIEFEWDAEYKNQIKDIIFNHNINNGDQSTKEEYF